jgi:hypothetical protein
MSKKNNEEEEKQYLKNLGKLEKIQIQSVTLILKINKVTDYESIIKETEEESKSKAKNATKKEIDKEISLLISPVKGIN